MKVARDSALLIAVPAVFLAAGAWWITTGGTGARGESDEFRFTLADRDATRDECPRWPAKLCADTVLEESMTPLCGGDEALAVPASRPSTKQGEVTPSAVWSGKILARDGTPIEGATIVIKGRRNCKLGDDTALDEEIQTAISGADGSLLFEMRPGFVYEIEVKANGYGLDKFFVQSQLSQDLVLDRASGLDGVILDKSTGLPLSGATVTFDNGYERYEVKTDPYGRYRFDGVGARAAHISVTDNRYLASGQPIDFLRPGQSSNLNLSLDQGMHLGGQVVADGSNVPVPNVDVTLMDRFTHQIVSSGRTDSYGRFSFWSLSPFRDYLVSAYGQGYASNLPAQTFGSQDSITVTVTPTWGLTVKVKADGLSVPGAKAWLSRQDGLPMDAGPTIFAESNANGMLGFAGLSRDLAYRVIVDHLGHATMAYGGLVASQAADQTLLVDLLPARTLQGLVVDGFGNAVPGATIRALRLDGVPAPALFVMADADGAFTFDSLAAGSISLVTFKAGFDNAHLVVEIPQDGDVAPVELVLSPINNFAAPPGGPPPSGGEPGSGGASSGGLGSGPGSLDPK